MATLVNDGMVVMDKPLLVAKKRSGSYIISLDISNPKQGGEKYMGKVKAWDKKKNTYFVFDYGENPKKVDDVDRWRRVLAGVKFGTQKMHSVGNIRTTAYYVYKLVGDMDPLNIMFTKQCKYGDPNSMFTDLRTQVLVDKKPKWSEAKNKYVYNFNGRCSVASVK